MDLHDIQRTDPKKKRKRIGRGGKRGTYAGRGIKGQNARSGTRFMPVVRELLKRYPKLRGVRSRTAISLGVSLNVRDIALAFEKGSTVTPAALLEKRVIRRVRGKLPPVKILAVGEISFPVTIKGCNITEGAREKIEKAGGSIPPKS